MRTARRAALRALSTPTQAAAARTAAVLRDGVRVAMGRANLELVRDAAAFELVERGLHPLPVGLRPDEDPDERRISGRHARLARRRRRDGSAPPGSRSA